MQSHKIFIKILPRRFPFKNLMTIFISRLIWFILGKVNLFCLWMWFSQRKIYKLGFFRDQNAYICLFNSFSFQISISSSWSHFLIFHLNSTSLIPFTTNRFFFCFISPIYGGVCACVCIHLYFFLLSFTPFNPSSFFFTVKKPFIR